MITVYKGHRGLWAFTAGKYYGGGYGTSAHALRDAWTFLGSMPAMIFMGTRP